MIEFELIQKFLEGIENPVIVDLGAADLSHSVQFRNMFDRAKIYSIEPDDFYRERNEFNSERFRLELLKGVISGKTERVLFYPSKTYGTIDTWPGSGSIYKPNHEVIENKYRGLTFDEVGYEVDSYSWDDFVDKYEIDRVDWLHIDAQGAEFDVISNITKTYPNFIFAEVCEFDTYHTGRNRFDFEMMMTKQGYTLIWDDGQDALYIRAKKVVEL